jgi:hypothetical protein
MAAQNWTIKVVPGTDVTDPATFVPDVYTPSGIAPDSLQAQFYDEVSWNDQTGQDHQLVLTDETFLNALTPETLIEITQWESSYPGYVPQPKDVSPATGSIIYYKCTVHPEEHGTITIVT